MFFADPASVIQEIDGHSVLITPHTFPERWSDAGIKGLYDASFLAVRRDANGRAALENRRQEGHYDVLLASKTRR